MLYTKYYFIFTPINVVKLLDDARPRAVGRRRRGARARGGRLLVLDLQSRCATPTASGLNIAPVGTKVNNSYKEIIQQDTCHCWSIKLYPSRG